MSGENHTPLPWSVRPNKFDDWGYIRGSDGVLACCARGLQDDGKSFDDYRRYKIDPYQANAALIVRSVNALPVLVKALEDAQKVLSVLISPGNENISSIHIWTQAVAAETGARAALASVRGDK